jgi:XRE family transcriptional regulator, regulator of sulfur utilization
MEIGAILKNLRKRKGLSQQNVADKANISRAYISQIENGETNPSIDTLESIGKVLCIPLPLISFLTLDFNSIPERKREDFLKIRPTILDLVEEYLQNGV